VYGYSEAYTIYDFKWMILLQRAILFSSSILFLILGKQFMINVIINYNNIIHNDCQYYAPIITSILWTHVIYIL